MSAEPAADQSQSAEQTESIPTRSATLCGALRDALATDPALRRIVIDLVREGLREESDARIARAERLAAEMAEQLVEAMPNGPERNVARASDKTAWVGRRAAQERARAQTGGDE